MKVTKPEITIDREEFADIILQVIRVYQDKATVNEHKGWVQDAVMHTMMKCFDSMVNNS